MAGKGTHLIEKYTHREDKIICVCGFVGSTEEFAAHRKVAPPIVGGKKYISPFEHEIRRGRPKKDAAIIEPTIESTDEF